jgi:hypothetical protein
MPTVAHIGPYRFFFYSNEGSEPPHVHIERDKCEAKFWLEPIRLAGNRGFRGKEINRIHDLVGERREEFLEAWNEHFHG